MYTGHRRVCRVYKGIQGALEYAGYTSILQGALEYTGYTRVYKVY